MNKCTGCQACQLACSIENDVTGRASWRRVYTYNGSRYPGVPHFFHSIACLHCVDPPCVASCPAGAYSKNPHTGAVTIDRDLCIGCRYCSWVCPYDAPRFDRSAGIMEKCTFCSHRLEDDREPACVALCPTEALEFGKFDAGGEDRDQAVPGFLRTGIGPAVRFVPLRPGQQQPVCTGVPLALPADVPEGEPSRREDSGITLRSEWPLAVFTLLMAALAGWVAAATLAGAAFYPVVFVVAGAAGVALSLTHLGRGARAYRAVFGWRRSWLSREVILVVAFLATATVAAYVSPGGGVGWWIAALLGFAALLAIDKVYDATETIGRGTHSADVFLTGLFLAALLSGHVVAFVTVSAIKAVLYIRRKIQFARRGEKVRPLLSLARIVLGFVLPFFLWPEGAGVNFDPVAVSVALGELIDRCEFYVELDLPTPAKQIELDLQEELGAANKS